MEPESRLGGGRYVVKGLLGEGAQGATYAAVEVENGRSVAIKRFDVRGARRWKDVELAEREARVLATLDHPLVARYIEHFEEDGALFLVMERVSGETLEAIRKREGPLPEAEVRRFLACADRAFSYLHGRRSPVIHRDVKPANVVRRGDGSYVLVDFGAVSDSLRRGTGSTVVGTMGYMAPEQLQGRSLPTSDVYAVGATALAALTGVEPEKLPHRGLRVDVRAALEGKASPELVTTLERMLEPDPDDRAPSLAYALENPPASAAAPAARRSALSRDDEAAAGRSIRKLLWALWGVGWILVPMLFGKFLGLAAAIPLVMFGWMAMIFIVTWHQNALIRAALRWWNAGSVEAAAPRQRVEVLPGDARVRVHGSELGPEEVVAGTELQADEARGERAR
ncbi:MAG TPA: serine/threonine-protein kinase [Polyangiaceae bacterium]